MNIDLEQIVPEFNLENFELHGLFSGTAIALDNHLRGRANDKEYQRIEYVAGLIIGESRVFRESRSGEFSDNQFFWEFYGRQEKEVKESEKANADRLVILSEDLKVVRSLPREKVEVLRGIMVNLSNLTRVYWNQHNLTGFKRYAEI